MKSPATSGALVVIVKVPATSNNCPAVGAAVPKGWLPLFNNDASASPGQGRLGTIISKLKVPGLAGEVEQAWMDNARPPLSPC